MWYYIVMVTNGLDGIIIGELSTTGNYGGQLFISDAGIKYRKLSGGTYGTWNNLITKADMQSGTVSITPTAINKSTYKSITFPVPFSAAPGVTVSPVTSGPDVVSASVSDVTSTGCKIYITRSDTTQATSVMWIAVAR